MNIFESCTFNTKPVKVQKVNNGSERELRRLEKQLNEHIKSTKGKNADRVKLNNYVEENQYNTSQLNDFIEKEISNKFSNKKWAALPMSLKWKLLADYAKDNDLDKTTLYTLKKQLKEGTIDVCYDNKIGQIQSINSIPQ